MLEEIFMILKSFWVRNQLSKYLTLTVLSPVHKNV